MEQRGLVRWLLDSPGFRDLGWLAGGSGATQAMGLISMVCMARIFTMAEIGEFFFIQSWMVALGGWGLPGLSSSLISSVARGEGGTYRRAVWLTSLAALGGSACLIGLGIWFDRSQNYLGLWAYIIAALAYPVSVNTTGFHALTGRRHYHQASLTQVAGKALNLLWLLVCALYRLGIGWFFVAQLLTTCAINLHLIASSWNRIGAKDAYNPEAIRYGIHLTISGVLLQPLSQIERLLVGLFFGTTNLAVFAFGETIYNNLRVMANISQNFYYPRLVHMPLTRVYHYLFRQGAIWTGCFLALAIVFTVVLPWVYPFLLGHQYGASARFAVYYSWAFAMSVPHFFSTIYLRHMRATKATYFYGLIRAPLNLGCLAASFSILGIFGLPVGRGVSNVIYGVAAIFLIKHMVEPFLTKNGVDTVEDLPPNLARTSKAVSSSQ